MRSRRGWVAVGASRAACCWRALRAHGRDPAAPASSWYVRTGACYQMCAKRARRACRAPHRDWARCGALALHWDAVLLTFAPRSWLIMPMLSCWGERACWCALPARATSSVSLLKSASRPPTRNLTLRRTLHLSYQRLGLVFHMSSPNWLRQARISRAAAAGKALRRR
jgi:hypothetical protein